MGVLGIHRPLLSPIGYALTSPCPAACCPSWWGMGGAWPGQWWRLLGTLSHPWCWAPTGSNGNSYIGRHPLPPRLAWGHPTPHVGSPPAAGHACPVRGAAETGHGAAMAAWTPPHARRPPPESGGLLQVRRCSGRWDRWDEGQGLPLRDLALSAAAGLALPQWPHSLLCSFLPAD